MSWTTVVDLPMTRYQASKALDHTEFSNDALILGSTSQNPGHVSLTGSDGQLEVAAAADSLQRFAGLRIEAVIRPSSLPHRLNIVEGGMAFAFFIEANGTLMATIYDGQSWEAVTSSVKVPINQWSRIQFDYDGISIGRLHLNGSTIGTRLDMPLGMRQPGQVITVGHWPRGDGRYTFVGDIGHVRIDRRDYEDAWRDAFAGMFCPRPLSPQQAGNMTELMLLVRSIEPQIMADLVECLRTRHERMRMLVRSVRAENERNIVLYRRLGQQLRTAWCCEGGIAAAKASLLASLRTIAGPADSGERQEFRRNLEELMDIGRMCQPGGPPFDRIRALMLELLPELASADDQFLQLLEAVEEAG